MRLYHHSLRSISRFTFSKSKKSLTFYEILEVNSDATEKEIKKSFLKKTKTMHPDTIDSPTEEANQAFQKLTEAYQTLKDPVTRKMYDINLRNGVNERPEMTQNFSHFATNKKFYENRWYGHKAHKDDLRFTEDFTTEYNDFINGGPTHIPFLRHYVSQNTYDLLSSARSKFFIMLALIVLFEYIYMRAKRTEDSRLGFLHELEEKKTPEYSLHIQQYIDGRATEKSFFIK